MSRSEAPSGTEAKPANLLVAFEGTEEGSAWQSMGDPIMGGQSEGRVSISEGCVVEFHGTVRADNGGGFASVKRDLPAPAGSAVTFALGCRVGFYVHASCRITHPRPPECHSYPLNGPW